MIVLCVYGTSLIYEIVMIDTLVTIVMVWRLVHLIFRIFD